MLSSKSLAFVVSAVFACGTAAVHAQAPPVRASQDVVVTATAIPIAAEWNGRTVIVVSAAELDRLGIHSLADALRLAPGVDVRARGPLDVQSDFSIRGATFGQNLILVDGKRLNDSQSGHHNGDIPAALVGIDRIEIVTGPGSAVHGADALGGTINFVTKRSAHLSSSATFGEHGYAAGAVSALGGRLPDRLGLSVWGSRSSGFEFDRDFIQAGGSIRANAGHWTFDARHVSRAFGARNFYGASPSKEWTDQSMAGAAWSGSRGAWLTTFNVFARNHGDHFRWDINRPGFAENRHRTNAGEAVVRLQRTLSGGVALVVGGGAGGDWVRSTNLGDRTYRRANAFAELQRPVTSRAFVTAGVRADTYSNFGSSLNPSVSAVVQASSTLRFRASVARAFRVPTFTELYYHDPANLGSPDLSAEHGWSLDAGVEWSSNGWTATFTPFVRRDSNVIDWVRATPADIWRTTNVRDVTSTGVESSLARRWKGALARGYVSALDVDAPSHGLLSKYVLEFARYSAGVSISTPLGGGLRAATTVDYRNRVDGQTYTLVGAKLSYRVRRADLFIDGTNLLNETYTEIAGVSMPGRWMMVGVTFGN